MTALWLLLAGWWQIPELRVFALAFVSVAASIVLARLVPVTVWMRGGRR